MNKIAFFVALASAVLLSSCIASMQTLRLDEPVVRVFEDLEGDSNIIYVKANDWMIRAFGDAESVIQFSDKEEGILIGKYFMGGQVSTSQYGSSDTRIYAIIDIRVKDNKARISIDPQDWVSYNSTMYPQLAYSKERVIKESELLIEDFLNHLKKSNVSF